MYIIAIGREPVATSSLRNCRYQHEDQLGLNAGVLHMRITQPSWDIQKYWLHELEKFWTASCINGLRN